MPNTYVGLLGTQPSKKNGNKTNKKNLKKEYSYKPVSALSPPNLSLISCEHQSAIKTAFKSPLMSCCFFPLQYNHFKLLDEGALKKQNMKKTSHE